MDQAATDTPVDGSSWSRAFRTIQPAVDASAPGDSIRVARGSYSENVTTKDNVALYGGYPTGGGTKDPKANVTTIDGGGRPGSVVTIPASAGTLTRIDGFTIQGGTGQFVNGSGPWGGGIYCGTGSAPVIENNIVTGNRLVSGSYTAGGGINADISSAPRIVGNTISGNDAEGGGYGGGIFVNYSSTPTFLNNKIEGNRAGAYGGGIYLSDGITATMDNNTVRGNALTGTGRGAGVYSQQNTLIATRNLFDGNGPAYWGGGIALQIVNATIANNRFTRNSGGNGGGIYLYQTGGTIINNVIDNNSAGSGAGIHVNPYSHPLIANNTIVYNTTPSGHGSGGGIRFETLYYTPQVSNNIVAFNSSGLDGAEGGGWAFPELHRNDVFGNLDGDYWAIDPRTPESGDFSVDPQLIPGTWQLRRIAGFNPCVDAGDNAAVPLDGAGNPLFPDFDGEARIQKGVAAAPVATVDVGADEIDARPPATSLSLAGTIGLNGWYRSAVTVTLTASDIWTDNTIPAVFPGTGVDYSETSFDGSTWIRYGAPFMQSANGQFVLDYRSVDKAGNVEAFRQATFKIDTVAPTVTSTVPANNATGVSRSATIRVNFSENVLAGSAYGSITLKKGTSSVAFSKSIGGGVLTLTPSTRLGANSTYSATIPAGAVTDLAGNPTTAATVITFKTGSN